MLAGSGLGVIEHSGQNRVRHEWQFVMRYVIIAHSELSYERAYLLYAVERF